MFTCNMCSIDCNCVFNNPYKNNIDMKANAPEKLYLHSKPYVDYGVSVVTSPLSIKDIKYIREDILLKKVQEYFKKNMMLHKFYRFKNEIGL